MVMDHIIAAVRFKDSIDVVKIIDNLRNDRMCLVQHTEQYRFAHQAAMDIITDAETSACKIYTTAENAALEAPAGGRPSSWSRHSVHGETVVYELRDGVIPASVRRDSDRAVFDPGNDLGGGIVPGSSMRRTSAPGNGLGHGGGGGGGGSTPGNGLGYAGGGGGSGGGSSSGGSGGSPIIPRQSSGPPGGTEGLEAEHKDLLQYHWYKPDFNKQQADQHLLQPHRKTGEFVVRKSSRHVGSFALNVRESKIFPASTGTRPQPHIKNMLVIVEMWGGGHGYKLGDRATITFPTIVELVSHFIAYAYDVDETNGDHLFLKFPEE